ncbi:MAG: hypothetical protein ABSH28_24145 [Acidobacteriota bacterium]
MDTRPRLRKLGNRCTNGSANGTSASKSSHGCENPISDIRPPTSDPRPSTINHRYPAFRYWLQPRCRRSEVGHCKLATAAILYGGRKRLANKTQETLINRQSALISNFGSQHTQLTTRGIRELRVYCEIVSFKRALEKAREMKPAGIVLSGGPDSVCRAGSPRVQPGRLRHHLKTTWNH